MTTMVHNHLGLLTHSLTRSHLLAQLLLYHSLLHYLAMINSYFLGLILTHAFIYSLIHLLTHFYANKIKLSYFPIQGVAEKVRLAFVLKGIDFEDERIPFDTFGSSVKATTKYGQLPLMTFQNGQVIAQSDGIHCLFNPILIYYLILYYIYYIISYVAICCITTRKYPIISN